MSTDCCPVCGCEQVRQILQLKDCTIDICRECGHGITRPLLTTGELTVLYDNIYFDSHFEQVLPGTSSFRKKIGQEEHRIRLVQQYKKRGRLLDVGCGLGYFLYGCRSFFDCAGYDITPANREYIERQLHIPFYSDEQWQEMAGSRFDVVTLWHSLEHFPEPEAQLRKFAALLSDDGILVIDVPNHASIDAAMEGELWPGWDVPFHRHHFSRDSLERLLNRVGFAVLGEHTYFCGHIRDRLRRNFFLRLFARPLAKLFPGSSIAVVGGKRVD